MDRAAELLIDVLTEPERMLALDGHHSNGVLRIARGSDLMSRLGARLQRSGVVDRLPATIGEHVQAVDQLIRHHHRGIRWEVDRIRHALRDTEVRPVLLKGAAYVMGELPMAQGRLSSDVDVLVEQDRLPDVEKALHQGGWRPLSFDEYDDRFYREWMHELPPLRHVERGTVIDVHHTILPLTGRVHPDPQLLLDAARPIGNGEFLVLAPEDMLLHSAAHLFQDGEVYGGLRDLTDLDIMLRHFGENEPGFWSRLVPRARELQLTRALYYALTCSTRLLRTPVPQDVLEAGKLHAPVWPVSAGMDHLVRSALIPEMRDGESWSRMSARFLLYVRSHWLRMPFTLLVRHLAHKAFHRHWKARGK